MQGKGTILRRPGSAMLTDSSSPTDLASLILSHKFERASQMVRNAPDKAQKWTESSSSPPPTMDASTLYITTCDCSALSLSRQDSWPTSGRACRKRRRLLRQRQQKDAHDTNNSVLNVNTGNQQLPLHLACALLYPSKGIKSNDQNAFTSLEVLIRDLVAAHPLACGEMDCHGRLALHEAIAWGATLQTISAIFMAYPEALYRRDSSGWLPLERNSLVERDDRDEVDQRLRQGYQVWEVSRTEAMLRFQLNIPSRSAKEVAESAGALAHVLGESSSDVNGPNTDGVIPQTRKLLKDVYARNKKLAESYYSLSVEKEKLQRTLKENGNSQRIHDLEDENGDLKRQLLRQEIAFHDLGFDASGNNLSFELSSREQAMSMMCMDPEPPTVLTKYLETKVGELAEENDQLEMQNEECQLRIEGLQKRTVELESAKSEATMPAPSEQEKLLTARVAQLEQQLAAANAENVLLREAFSESLNFNTELKDHSSPRREDALPPTTKIPRTSTHSMEGKTGLTATTKIPRRSTHSLEEQLKVIDRLSAHGSSEPNFGTEGARISQKHPKSSRRMSLGDQLKEIDRRSGHGDEPFVGETEKWDFGTRQGRDEANIMPIISLEVSFGSKDRGNENTIEMIADAKDTNGESPANEEVQLEGGHDSFRTSSADSHATGHGSRVSSTSWGMLSLAQKSSRKPIKKKWSTPTPLATLAQEGNDSKNSIDSFHVEAFHDSFQSLNDVKALETDSLEDLYKSAADIFSSTREDNKAFDGHKSIAVFNLKDSRKKSRRNKPRRNSDGGALPAVNVKKQGSRKPKRDADAIAETARLLAAEEEIIEIVKHTEENLQITLPEDLVTALREASLNIILAEKKAHASESLHPVAEAIIDYKLIDEAEKKYGETFSSDVVFSLRAAAISCVETSQQEIEAMELTKRRLEKELLDALIETAERQLHKSLPRDVAVALREAAAAFDSLLMEDFEQDGQLLSIRLDFKELDRMFEMAQTALGKPFTEVLIVALRRASFVLQSRLEGTDFTTAQETSGRSKRSTLDAESGVHHPMATELASPNLLSGKPPHTPTALRQMVPPAATMRADEAVDSPSVAGSRTDMSLQIGTLFPALTMGSVDDGEEEDDHNPIDSESPTAGSLGLTSATGIRGGRDSYNEVGDKLGDTYQFALSTSSNKDNLDTIYGEGTPSRTGSDISKEGKELNGPFKQASSGRKIDHDGSYEDSTNGTGVGSGSDLFVPLKSPANKTTTEGSGNLSGNRRSPQAEELASIVKAAKDVLGRDITPELMDALKLLSQASVNSHNTGVKRFPRKLSRNSRSTVDDDNDETKSTDMSRQSEMSLNLSAVFDPNGPSDLERKLKNLDRPKEGQSTRRKGQKKDFVAGTGTSNTEPGEMQQAQPDSSGNAEKVTRRGRSPTRGVKKSKSGDIDLLATAAKVTPLARRARSAERRGENRERTTRLNATATGESIVNIVERSGTDDLDQLYKRVAKKVDGDTTLLASTLHMQGKTGTAALEAIFSDTEETYGIEIPTDIVEALQNAAMDTFENPEDVPFIFIVRSLHDEGVIREAERKVGRAIPADLLGAIRSTSLPPGVSVETLRPLDGSSSVIATKKYNSSVGSMAFSLAMSDLSSRRSHTNSTRSAFLRGSSSNRGSSYRGSSVGGQVLSLGDSSQETRSESTPENLTSLSAGDKSSLALEPSSTHSDNSWTKLSLSKSPASTGRKRKSTKKHKKGTKDAMFERAQKRKEKVAQFMNSLTDLGGPTDDLKNLFKQAKETLEANSPADVKSRKKTDEKRQSRSQQGYSIEKLQAVLEGEGSHGSIDSMDDTSQDAEESAILNPDGSESCITTSPQEAELDMLLARFREMTGRAVPLEIDMALRKASRSMDESLDLVAPLAVLTEQQHFGSHLTEEKLDFIYGEAEIFLGRDIDAGILATLISAAKDLMLLEQKLSSSYASIFSTEDLAATNDPATTKSVDSLLGVAEGDEDDLGALYRAAYAQAPRSAAASPPRKQPDFVAPHFSTPLKRPSASARMEIPLVDDGKGQTEAKPHNRTPDKSPPRPSFPSLPGRPVSQINQNNESIDLTESGGFLYSISPMTEASHYTNASIMDNSGNMMDMVENSKDNLRKLSKVPTLDDSNDLLDYEEDILEPSYSTEETSEASGSVHGGDRNVQNTHSSHTSLELDAIISEAQQEYGVELPSELVEALKTASASSFNDLESMSGSNVSSLIMKHITTTEDEKSSDNSDLRGIMTEVQKKLSDSDDDAARQVAQRWQVEDYVESLIKGAEDEVSKEIPRHLVTALWQGLCAACNGKKQVGLSSKEISSVLTSLPPESQKALFPELAACLQKRSQDLMVSCHASGYFSAASSGTSEDRSIQVEEFAEHDSNVKEIISEIEKVNGDIPKELVHRLMAEPKRRELPATSEHSELAGVGFSGSSMSEHSTELEYSQSTFSSMHFGSSHGPARMIGRSSQASANLETLNEDNLGGIVEKEKLPGIDQLLREVEKEYGGPLPDDLLVALKQISATSGLTLEPELVDGKLLESGKLDVKLSPQVAGALKRAVSKTISRSLSQVRQNSNISALSGLSKISSATSLHTSASDWTTEHETKASSDDSATVHSFASEGGAPLSPPQPLPPPPPPPPPPPVENVCSTSGNPSTVSGKPVNKNLGKSLLKEVKQVYDRKIPLELAYVLSRSQALSNAMNTDEEIQIILEECEDMSGKRLPADLVLALREASVIARAPPTTSKSRRSKFNRQGSGSLRSTSRSSGMPSIQEWAASTIDGPSSEKADPKFEVDRVPSSFGPLSIPAEIAAEERSNMDISTLKDSQHTDGTSIKPAKPRKHNEAHDVAPLDPSSHDETIRKNSRNSIDSVPEYEFSDHSIGLDAIFNSSLKTFAKPKSANGSTSAFSASGSINQTSVSPGKSPGFNASTATLIVSNTQDFQGLKSRIRPPPFEAIQDNEDATDNNEEEISPLRSSSFVSRDSIVSTGSSTSTEITNNNTNTVSGMDEVSRASTLPSRRLPLGVNPTPPLDGVETDDLSAIFKEAAKRFS